MPRRARATKRVVLPDSKYHNENISRLINRVLSRGKKTTAEGIVYGALEIIENESKKNPMEVFDLALKNITPVLEVKARRVGGATYQVPIEIRPDRRQSLALRWLVRAARSRKGQPMVKKLASELLDASQGQGVAVKKRQETHSMAEANKAFAHYRW